MTCCVRTVRTPFRLGFRAPWTLHWWDTTEDDLEFTEESTMSTHRERRPMRVNHTEPDLENHDRGLDHDLPRLIGRRGLLTLAIGAGAATAVGCSVAADTDTAAATAVPSSSAESTASASASSSATDLEPIPEETGGPFPGDGSNGVNVLRRPVATHPLRGLPQSGQGDQQHQQDRHLADGAPRGRLPRGLRDQRLRAEPEQPESDQPRHRQRVRGRVRPADPTLTGSADDGYSLEFTCAV
jgi:hypothetical protein